MQEGGARARAHAALAQRILCANARSCTPCVPRRATDVGSYAELPACLPAFHPSAQVEEEKPAAMEDTDEDSDDDEDKKEL